jgi:hypothetical protein
MSIKQLEEHIMVSLFISPATLQELMQRDFLKNRADFMVDRILMRLEGKGYVFFRGGKYHTYKKIAKTKLREYEL